MCLTETKILDSKACLNNCTPKGYKFFQAQRKGAQTSGGGGVAVIIRSGFFSSKRIFQKYSVEFFEFLALEVISKPNTIPKAVVTIYRPPTKGVTAGFLNEFQAFCEMIQEKYGNNTIFTGDFNIHVNNLNDSGTRQFLQMLTDLALMNHVNQPTFRRSNNILDLVIDSYTNRLVHEVSVDKQVCISDHFLISFKLKIEREKILKSNKVITFREFKKKENKDKCADYLKQAFSGFNKFSDVVSQCLNLHKIFALILSYFPSQTKTITVSDSNPWYNSKCRLKKLALRKAERKYSNSLRKAPSKKVIAERRRNQTRLKTEKNEYGQVLKDAKSEYYSNIFSLASSNPKKTYRVISELLGEGFNSLLPDIANTNPQLFVDNFSEYLNTKIKDIRHKIETSDIPKKVYPSAISYIPLTKFSSLSETEMNFVFNNCNKTFCTLDSLDFRKFEADLLKPYFLKLVNTMFDTGIFPKSEKSAVITPLVKDISADLNNFGNYRGISKIAMPSKILESCIYFRLQEYVTINNILPDFQSAYRPGYSTETALVKIYNDVITAKDLGRSTVMLSLDLSAAFDTIDHGILIERLRTARGQY